jgi:hypothetical protein
MKTWQTAIMAGALAASSGAQDPPPDPPDLDAWIQQTNFGTGQEFLIEVGSEGYSAVAAGSVGEAGARFELWAKGTAWDDTLYLLDTEFLDVYSPEASIVISSEDPYVQGDPDSGSYVKRTRADRQFTVEIHVAGLLDPTAEPPPNAAELNVFFSAEGRNYDMLTYSGLGQDPYSLTGDAYGNRGNGDETFPLYHELTVGDCGEQIYSIERHAADGIPAAILAQPKIEVWPVSAATLSVDPADDTQGIDAVVFEDKIPPLFLTMKHLYPDSRTYAQIYSGTEVVGTVGTVIGGTERKYGTYYPDAEPTNVPQDENVSLDNLSLYADADGIYTFEVITETPFFPEGERLMYVTFEVDRVILVRGLIAPRE